MDVINELTELFRKFPGIGPRQANRFVHFLLERNDDAERLSALAKELPTTAARCSDCRRFFAHEKNVKLCKICRDPARDNKILLIVARDTDLDTIEKSGTYRGKYFVLGGTIPILEKEPQKRAAMRELIARAAALAEKGLSEIVLALSANPEGENTANEAARALASLAKKRGIKISALGRGLSTGSELEYCDPETLKNALANRR